MVLGALGLFKKFFRAESDPKMWFRCIAHNVMHYSVSDCPAAFGRSLDGAALLNKRRKGANGNHNDFERLV